MRQSFLLFLCVLLFACACSGNVDDEYLASLPESERRLAPVDSLDLESIGVLSPAHMIKYGRWVVFKESQTKYNLAIVNLDSHRKMDAIPVGRGPGEMTLGDNLYLEGTGATLTDAYMLTMVSLDMSELKENYIPSLDTIGIFKPVKNAFSRLRKVKGGYVSPVPSNHTFGEETWYSLWDVDGYCSKPIPRPLIDGIEKTEQTTCHSFYSSSVITVHPDKDRFCIGLVRMAALSFVMIENRNLKEVKRMEYNRPELYEYRGKTFIHANRAFSSITSDKDLVFLLYSGRKRNDEIPEYEGNHIIVYDWSGNYVTRYFLSQNVMDIFIDGDELYCLSTYPSCKLYVYRLPEIS